MSTSTETIDETDAETRPRFTTVHSRYHVGCSCCGLVSVYSRKAEAKRAMIQHLGCHELSETIEVSSFDSMRRGGATVVYGGRIHGGIRSHGLGMRLEMESK